MSAQTTGVGRRLRDRLTYANVAATLALALVVSGGTAYAADKLITGNQIAKGTITAKNIKGHSLLAKDFAKGQLPAGKPGPTGKTGSQGPAGPAGPAGSALAYATVTSTGTTTAAFVNSNAGFTSVTHPQPGFFCVSPRINGADGLPIEPLLTVYGSSGTTTYTPAVVPGGVCPGAYQIDLFPGPNSGSTPIDPEVGSGFVIEIP